MGNCVSSTDSSELSAVGVKVSSGASASLLSLQFPKSLIDRPFEDVFALGDIAGQGAFGAVHKARATTSGAGLVGISTKVDLAIKIVIKKDMNKDDIIDLVQEVRTLAKVSHSRSSIISIA